MHWSCSGDSPVVSVSRISRRSGTLQLPQVRGPVQEPAQGPEGSGTGWIAGTGSPAARACSEQGAHQAEQVNLLPGGKRLLVVHLGVALAITTSVTSPMIPALASSWLPAHLLDWPWLKPYKAAIALPIALQDQNGVERRSDQLAGKSLVLFFYPKDDTPATMEACAFRDSYADLQALGAGFGGSAATTQVVASGSAATTSYPLLVDQNNRLRKAFGVPEFSASPGRVTYVIDAEGWCATSSTTCSTGRPSREALECLKRLSPRELASAGKPLVLEPFPTPGADRVHRRQLSRGDAADQLSASARGLGALAWPSTLGVPGFDHQAQATKLEDLSPAARP